MATILVLALLLLLVGAPTHDGPSKAAVRTRRIEPAKDAPRPVRGSSAGATGGVLGLARAAVTVSPGADAIKIPSSFLGVSTEYWSLPLLERHMAALQQVLSLLHVPGSGPLVLRIGGDSADHSFWDPKLGKAPRWVFRLTPKWLAQTSALVRGLRAKVILDLNLVTGSPLEAVEWARVAQKGLPRGSLTGFEIGNEPDLYDRSFWRATTARRWLGAAPVPLNMSSRGYARDFVAYGRLLTQVASTVPLVAPAIGHPGLDDNWISTLLAEPHPGLRIVSAHWYPYSGCVPRSSPSYPTIGRLLGGSAARMARRLRPIVRRVHRGGLRFRLTELNSVTCGGLRGVSDTFATALWAPDALFELARAGVDGVNVHIRVHTINAPFALTARGVRARPFLYGLILFARTLGPDPQIVNARLHASRSLRLKVWAVRALGDTLHVLLIDKGTRSVRVYLHLPARGPATVERLLAPSVRSVDAVTLDGQRLGSDGRWQGSPAHETISLTGHAYQLTVPQLSAALVVVHLR